MSKPNNNAPEADSNESEDFVSAALERQRQRAIASGYTPRSGSFRARFRADAGRLQKTQHGAATEFDEYGRPLEDYEEESALNQGSGIDRVDSSSGDGGSEGNRVMKWRPRPGFARSRSGTKPNRFDPASLSQVLSGVSESGGWNRKLTIAGIAAKWPQIVGVNVAQHCAVESFTEEVLVIRADSTAWMNQMRILLPTIERRIREELGVAAVRQVQIVGPVAPSWKRGRWSVPGRGPRDTYG